MTKLAPSEHNHSTAEAISSGVPMRAIGSLVTNASTAAGSFPVKRSIISVWMTPGQTAFTRTPSAASSSAAAFVAPDNAVLLAT